MTSRTHTAADGAPRDAGAADPKVTPLGDERRHYWLALEMSRIAGLDLQAELDSGRISHTDWANMVTRCRGCTWSSDCPAWMRIVHEAMPDAPGDAPCRCDNADRFRDLRLRAEMGGDQP